MKKLLNIIKKAPPTLEADLNKEAEFIGSQIKRRDKIEKFNMKNCFINLKDHEVDFQNKPVCRLINPSKTQMGNN